MQKSGISENEQMLNKPIETEKWYDKLSLTSKLVYDIYFISIQNHSLFFHQCMYKLDFGTTKCPKIINANELYRFSEIIDAFSKIIIIFGWINWIPGKIYLNINKLAYNFHSNDQWIQLKWNACPICIMYRWNIDYSSIFIHSSIFI